MIRLVNCAVYRCTFHHWRCIVVTRATITAAAIDRRSCCGHTFALSCLVCPLQYSSVLLLVHVCILVR